MDTIKTGRIVDLHEQGLAPETIAEQTGQEVKEVQLTLIENNLDWAPKPLKGGRPRKPLLPGQQRYVELGYRRGLSQSALADYVQAPILRVRRHLSAAGLLHETQARITSPERAQRVLQAVELYLKDVPVMDIVKETGIRTPVLYAALKRRNVPLRMRHGPAQD